MRRPKPDPLDKLRRDREHVFVVISYQRPPRHFPMHLSESGKSWFRRATGPFAADIAVALRKHKIHGVVRRSAFLAGSPGWTPPVRQPSGNSTGLRNLSPAEFARRSFKGRVTTFDRITGEITNAAAKGQSAPPQTAVPPLGRGPNPSAFRVKNPSSPLPPARLRALGRKSRKAKPEIKRREPNAKAGWASARRNDNHEPPPKRYPRWSRT